MQANVSPVLIAQQFNLKIVGNTDVLIQTVGSIKIQQRDAILWAKNIDNLKKINFGYVIVSSFLEIPDINFNVTNKGHIVLGKMSNESLISDLNLLVDSIFKITVLELPKLYPAIKRGQPVNTNR